MHGLKKSLSAGSFLQVLENVNGGVAGVVAGFLWVDRWEPEPAKFLLLAFAWGACIATITALLINTTAEAVGDELLGKGSGNTVAALVSAQGGGVTRWPSGAVSITFPVGGGTRATSASRTVARKIGIAAGD